MRWDIFCRVIDNHGDLGVCWRLSADLAQRGHHVRLWVDDASALRWMAPHGHDRVQVLAWPDAPEDFTVSGDVVVEAFGCELPAHVQAVIAAAAVTPHARPTSAVTWVNLEYLSAEAYVARQHGLPSPVMSGPAKGCTKWFFFPGFTNHTGGLLREPSLLTLQQSFDRSAWRALHAPAVPPGGRWMSLFCYEPAGLPHLLNQLAGRADRLCVTPGRAQAALQAATQAAGTRQALDAPNPSVTWYALDYTDQAGFDQMLWACDLNLVRGEDSLVRALWAGQPLIWQIYPQDDQAHHAKLEAFLDWLDAPPSLRHAHRVWNGLASGPMPLLDPNTLASWAACVRAARTRLLDQCDLTTQLIRFVGASPE